MVTDQLHRTCVIWKSYFLGRGIPAAFAGAARPMAYAHTGSCTGPRLHLNWIGALQHALHRASCSALMHNAAWMRMGSVDEGRRTFKISGQCPFETLAHSSRSQMAESECSNPPQRPTNAHKLKRFQQGVVWHVFPASQSRMAFWISCSSTPFPVLKLGISVARTKIPAQGSLLPLSFPGLGTALEAGRGGGGKTGSDDLSRTSYMHSNGHPRFSGRSPASSPSQPGTKPLSRCLSAMTWGDYSRSHCLFQSVKRAPHTLTWTSLQRWFS